MTGRDVPVLRSVGGTSPGTGHTGSERYVLQAAAVRRRQLRAAFLHGSRRSWRQRQALWPAGVAGAVLVAVMIAVIAVTGAFDKQQRLDQSPSTTATP